MNPFEYWDSDDSDFDYQSHHYHKRSIRTKSEYNNVPFGYWQTKTDGRMKISDMTNSHLENSINLMRRNKKFTPKYYELIDEKNYRVVRMNKLMRDKIDCLIQMSINRHLINIIYEYALYT